MLGPDNNNHDDNDDYYDNDHDNDNDDYYDNDHDDNDDYYDNGHDDNDHRCDNDHDDNDHRCGKDHDDNDYYYDDLLTGHHDIIYLHDDDQTILRLMIKANMLSSIVTIDP